MVGDAIPAQVQHNGKAGVISAAIQAATGRYGMLRPPQTDPSSRHFVSYISSLNSAQACNWPMGLA